MTWGRKLLPQQQQTQDGCVSIYLVIWSLLNSWNAICLGEQALLKLPGEKRLPVPAHLQFQHLPSASDPLVTSLSNPRGIQLSSAVLIYELHSCSLGRSDEDWPGLWDTFCFFFPVRAAFLILLPIEPQLKKKITLGPEGEKERSHLPCEVMTWMLHPRRWEEQMVKGLGVMKELELLDFQKNGWITGQNHSLPGKIMRNNHTALAEFKGIGQGPSSAPQARP